MSLFFFSSKWRINKSFSSSARCEQSDCMELKSRQPLTKSHQCHHKPLKKKTTKKRDFSSTLSVIFFFFLFFFFSSPKTCYELLNIASEESTLGRQKCTLSRELEMHSQSCSTNVNHRAHVTYLPIEVVSLILSIFSSSIILVQGLV